MARIRSAHAALLERFQNAQSYYASRNEEINKARALFEMAGSEEEKKSYVNFVGNVPFTAVRLAASLLVANRPFLVRPSEDTDLSRASAGRVEQLCYAGLRESDELAFSRGHELFQLELVQSMLVDGWYAGEVLLVPDHPVTPFQVRTLDPANCYPEFGNSDTNKVFYFWTTLGSDLEREFGVRVSSALRDELIEVINCWWYEGSTPHNALLGVPAGMGTDEQGGAAKGGLVVVRDITAFPDLRKLPILCGPVFGTHYVGPRSGTPTPGRRLGFYSQTEGNIPLGYVTNSGMGISNDARYKGMSWLYGIKDVVRHFNDILSDIALAIKKFAVPTVVVKTRGGRFVEIALGTGDVNILAQDEGIEQLWVSGQPPNFDVFLREARRMIDAATIPDRQQATSALQLSILNNLTLQQLTPWVQSTERFYVSRFRREIQQYEALTRTDQNKFSRIWGRDRQDRQFFLATTSSDIGGFYDMEVSLEPITMYDEITRVNAASVAVQSKLLSREDAYERYRLGRDYRRTHQRINAEIAEAMPEIQMAMALEAMVKQRRMVAARILAGKLSALFGQQVPVAGEEQPPGGPQINERTGLPERQLLPSSVVSAEAQQGSPLPEFQAAAGLPSAGTQPRPGETPFRLSFDQQLQGLNL